MARPGHRGAVFVVATAQLTRWIKSSRFAVSRTEPHWPSLRHSCVMRNLGLATLMSTLMVFATVAIAGPSAATTAYPPIPHRSIQAPPSCLGPAPRTPIPADQIKADLARITTLAGRRIYSMGSCDNGTIQLWLAPRANDWPNGFVQHSDRACESGLGSRHGTLGRAEVPDAVFCPNRAGRRLGTRQRSNSNHAR